MATFDANAGRMTHFRILGMALLTCRCLLAADVLSAQALTPDEVRTMTAAMVVAPVDRALVLFRQDAGQAGGAVDPLILTQISVAAGQNVVDAGASPTGARVLQLSQPVQLGAVRELLGVLRQRADVVWAELDPAQRQVPLSSSQRSRILASKFLDAEAANVVQLMITLSDLDTQQASRENKLLGPDWDAMLSEAALVPLHVARATVGGAWIVQLPYAMNEAEATAIASRLVASRIVRYADPDLPVTAHASPNDPWFLQGPQWALYDPFTTPYYGIDATDAWTKTTGSPALVVAVVDTGVLPHPDFSSRLLAGYDFVDASNSHDGLGPHPSGSDPGNWHSGSDCPGKAAANSDWHGTHVAGIIAATGNNSYGVAGINWNSKILPVRVLGTCGGNTSDALVGMQWAAGLPVPGFPTNANPARVINMSLGGKGTCTPQDQALVNQVLARGSLVVASAGNDDGIADNQVPGACLGLSTVAATGPYGDRAPYSNFAFGIDISAPGGDQTFGTAAEVLSTFNLGTTSPAEFGYHYYQGTSQAAPQVSGVASLMLSVNPSLTPAQLKALMALAPTPFAPGSLCNFSICGAGIVNAFTSVAFAVIAGYSPITAAIEYHHAQWDHYFVTASPDEIAALDGGAFGAVWQRTGMSFPVWTQNTGAQVPTCRFFSTGFPPKSTHFYTPFATECNGLKADPNWQFEAIAFYLQLPNASGLCGTGSVPLYRVFNNFMGGAPNHRYTTSVTVLNQMIAAGWTFEGNSTTKVFACVPQGS